MKTWDNIKTLDKKFSWSFFGFLLGAIGIIFSIYTIYFHKESPIIEYYELTNTDVLDIRENLTKLDIVYDSVSIKNNHQSLRIITLKIANNGNEALGPQHYDEDYPLGLTITRGTIVESPQIINTSNDYIAKKLRIEQKSQKEISFSKVIINQGEFFTLKLLLLTKENVMPQVIPSGYITGYGKPLLRLADNELQEEGFLESLIHGNVVVHILRFIIYFILFIVIMLAIIIPSVEISDKRSRRKRKSIVEKFKKHTKIKEEDISTEVVKYYMNWDERYLYRIQNFISKENMILDYKKYVDLENKISDFNDDLYDHPGGGVVVYDDKRERKRDVAVQNSMIMQTLLENKIIEIGGDKIQINDNFKRTLDDFIYFIKIQ